MTKAAKNYWQEVDMFLEAAIQSIDRGWCRTSYTHDGSVVLDARSAKNRPCLATSERAVAWTIEGALFKHMEDEGQTSWTNYRRTATMIIKHIKQLPRRMWYPELPESPLAAYSMLEYFNNHEEVTKELVLQVLREALAETHKRRKNGTAIKPAAMYVKWDTPHESKKGQQLITDERSETAFLLRSALKGSGLYVESNIDSFTEYAMSFFDSSRTQYDVYRWKKIGRRKTRKLRSDLDHLADVWR